MSQFNIVEFLLELFARRGAEEYMGEAVSMAQHMEQAAAGAVADGAKDELVIAALLHDIGHFVSDFPIDALKNGQDNIHQEAGAEFLSPYFPRSVTEPIRLHVAAKKYLCAKDSKYLDKLSAASIQSLEVQGGPMNADQVKVFEANPFHCAAIKVRLYDDGGKTAGVFHQSVDYYRSRLEALRTDKETGAA